MNFKLLSLPSNHFKSYRTFCKVFRMSKVFVRNALHEERLQISFVFPPTNSSDLDVKVKQRVYNFDRLKNETVELTLMRISANISKVINKSLKKKSRVVGNENIAQDVNVVLLQDEVTPVSGDELNGQAWVDGLCLKIDEHQMIVKVNMPTVKKLSLPEIVMIGCAVHPKVEVEFGDLKDFHFIWYRKIWQDQSSVKIRSISNSVDSEASHIHDTLNEKSIEKFESTSETGITDSTCSEILRNFNVDEATSNSWQEIHQGRVYIPVCNDEGYQLKLDCLPVCDSRLGEAVSAVTKSYVINGPVGKCPFEKRHQHTKNLMGSECFRFVTYNILAGIYADSDFSRDVLFPHCPAYALSMDYRKLLLIKEIKGYNADIICLQEVDRKVFEADLIPQLGEVGFSGLICLKASDAAEGCATFFRTNKFRLVSQHNITLSKDLQEDSLYADLRERICTSEAMQEKVFARTQVLQVTILESTEGAKQQILVAVVHLYFHPRAPHIRILQTALCLRHIERVLDQHTQQGHSRPTVVFCGDFNSYPESGLHSFVKQKQICAEHADWYAGGKAEFVDNMNLHHSLDLWSACGYPRYTNYVAGFAGCLDYIYIEPKYLDLLAVIPLPSHEEVTKFTALPNAVFPSDHLALVCELAFKSSV